MSHYAKIENGIVTQVIVADYDFKETLPGKWVRTSYNTYANQHARGNKPLRANFAGVGYTYDEVRDVFIPPKPFKAWKLDETKFIWVPPFNPPDDGGMYEWEDLIDNWKRIDVE